MQEYPNLSWRHRLGIKITLPLSFIHNTFFWHTNDRPKGISCIIRVKDEEDWIELSMKSAVSLADELVVVDSGSQDNSFDIANKVKKVLQIPVKVFKSQKLNFCEQSNLALSQTSYSWVMRWDADFIGTSDISELRDKVLSIRRGDYLIYLTTINLDGDLEHTFFGETLMKEGYIHYYRSYLKFKMFGRFEMISIPLYYKRIFIHRPYIFHLRSVKPAKKLLFRAYWTRWMETADYKKYPKLEDFIKEKIRKEYGTDSIREAIKIHMKRSICSHLIRYRPERYREYPEILNEALKKPNYKIIYRDGVPVGRNDTLN